MLKCKAPAWHESSVGHLSILVIVEIPIERGRSMQGGVRSVGDQAALLKNEDAGRVADGAEAVRDHEGGATLHEFLKRRLDHRLAFGVECGSGFIEHENGGVF